MLGWELGGATGVIGRTGGGSGSAMGGPPSDPLPVLPPPQATRNTGKSIANRNIANPTATLLAACMMLDHLRWGGAALGKG